MLWIIILLLLPVIGLTVFFSFSNGKQSYISGSCVLKKSTVECWFILSIDPQLTSPWWYDMYQSTLHGMSVKISQFSTDCQLRSWSSVDPVSVKMSIKCQLRCWGLIKGIDPHLTTGSFNTNDPHFLLCLCSHKVGTQVFWEHSLKCFTLLESQVVCLCDSCQGNKEIIIKWIHHNWKMIRMNNRKLSQAASQELTVTTKLTEHWIWQQLLTMSTVKEEYQPSFSDIQIYFALIHCLLNGIHGFECRQAWLPTKICSQSSITYVLWFSI